MRGIWAALAALAMALPGPASAQPPVWIVRDGNSTILLFGSVHILPEGLDWRPPALTAALATADDVWFELPVNVATDATARHLSETLGMLPEKDDLFNYLTLEQTLRLTRMAASLDLSLPTLRRMRPWLAEVTISVVADGRQGGSSSDGVEEQVQALAPVQARRRAFETPEQQIDFLAGAPMADQIASLDESLREMEEKPQAYREIVDDWITGDLAAIETDALDPLRRASPTLFDRLITSRNRRWTKVIERRLKRSGTTVIVVGMGHLVGAGGVPALLRADGLTVEGPSDTVRPPGPH
jgi:uncharacterized protein YbaP (TraB family)